MHVWMLGWTGEDRGRAGGWERERDAIYIHTHTTTNDGIQNGSSMGICTHRVYIFARLGVDLHAQSVLINKISASELSRKFIKSVLLVGHIQFKGGREGGAF